MERNTARFAAAALLAAVAVFQGCSKSESGSTPTDEPRHSYTVRGKVVSVPSPDRPVDELQIRHEAIPDYADREGNVFVNSKGVRGMGSMTMGFPVAEGVSLEGITPGDIVEFTFVVSWGEKYPVYAVSAISELPADTPLDFSGGMGDE